MSRDDNRRVVEDMRLSTGHVFPVPVTLPVAADAPVRLDHDVALRHERNDLLAILTVEEIYPWDHVELAAQENARLVLEYLVERGSVRRDEVLDRQQPPLPQTAVL